jgi:patatin-related protein
MPRDREVRLGIVLYGGVSLAVYENGVAQELHRAIRGDGVYGLLKELIGSDIVVDIISGTSAGGVNGIMLGYALANKRAFAPSADLWREQGDIQSLLRSEHDPNADSILDSGYYQDKLDNCFRNALTPDASAPEIEELDLFITGTDANGDIYTVYDDQGHAIDVKNHRALFKLAVRRGDRKNDLATATPADLARLSRLTSCFPVAFEPVRIDLDDEAFVRWGKLRNPAVYLDGGILNNKPFTSTIDAISRRAANRDVERFLIYVEPNPEVFTPLKKGVPPHSPSIVQAGVSALTSIPGYQSIAADLEAIEAHNERAERVNSIFEAIGKAPETSVDCLDRAGVLIEEQAGCDNTAYLACRSIQLRDTAVASMLNDKAGRAFISDLEERRSGRILVQSFDYWPGDGAETLARYDVFFRMRRAVQLSDSLMRRVKAGDFKVDPETWDLVNHYFKLYEMTQWAMVRWMDEWESNWRALGPAHKTLDTLPETERLETLRGISVDVWGQAKERMERLLHGAIEVPSAPTSAARATFYTQLSAAMKPGAAQTVPPPDNLLDRIDASFKAALKALGDGDVARLLRNEFCRFLEVDRQLFPIQLGSDFESTNVVRVVRFSPRDAQRGLSTGLASSKVCGSALGAFGGFFKKSWRANDIMIGRLDAACQLLECLITKERLANLPGGRSFTPAQLIGWFPHIGEQGAITLASTINTYLQAPRAATQPSWEQLLNEIVGACHNEIQLEEWPRVIVCAMQQEYEWGRYLRNPKTPAEPFDRSNLVWNRAKGTPDQVLVGVAAIAIASGTIAAFKPGSVAGRAFLDEIPDTVLQELGTLAGIRLGKGVLDSIPNPEARKRVEGSRFYGWPFGIVLPALYRWAHMRRIQPDTVVVFNTAIPILCLAVFVLAALLGLGIHVGWQLALGMAAGSLAMFYVWWRWFRR